MVTICNWNQEVDVFCPYCTLVLEKCFDYSQGDNNPDCTLEWYPISYQTQYGKFYCFQYNNDSNNPIVTQKIGYGGSMSLIFSVSSLVVNEGDRVGIQVSFTVPGITPDVYSETKFAPPDYDTFHAMTQVVTSHNSIVDNVTFQSSASLTRLSRNYTDTNTTDYVGITFAYGELSVESIDYSPRYTIVNFFGDFAGMIGTLCGLDAIKVLAGARLIPKLIRRRNFHILQEHFNG